MWLKSLSTLVAFAYVYIAQAGWAENSPAQSVQPASEVDPTAELCAIFSEAAKAVVFDGKPICKLKECSAKGVNLACDDFPVSIPVPHWTNITDTLNFDAVLDLCPGGVKPMSLTLSFHDTGLTASGTKEPSIKWYQQYTSGEQIPVSIPVASVAVAEIDAKVTVEFQVDSGLSSVHTAISLDICASVQPVFGPYCGASLLPHDLPVRLIVACSLRVCF